MFELFGQWTIYEKLVFIVLVITSFFTVSMDLKSFYNWNKGREEKEEYEKMMEDPLDVEFFIPPSKDYKIGYAKQDDKAHFMDEIEIPEGV